MPDFKYVQVEDLIISRVRNKSILHLGCAGVYLNHGKDACLHYQIHKVGRRLAGVEIKLPLLNQVKEWVSESDTVHYWEGDVEQLDTLGIAEKFEIVLAGSIIEHLSNPGKMLEGINNVLKDDGELIIVTPNVFGIMQFARVLFSRREAVNREHTCWFSVQTLTELCSRYNFVASEWFTGYGWRSPSRCRNIQIFFGVPFFKLFPWVGGSLIGVFHKSLPQNNLY